MAKSFDWEIKVGQDESFGVAWPGFDATGFTGVCQIRERADKTSPVRATPTVEIDIANGDIGEGETGCHFIVRLSAEQSTAMGITGNDWSDITKFAFDVELVSPTGTPYRPIQGRVLASPNTTQTEA